MPKISAKHQPVHPAPRQEQDPPAAPSSSRKQDDAVVWPRDLNAPTTADPIWGTDPETLRDA